MPGGGPGAYGVCGAPARDTYDDRPHAWSRWTAVRVARRRVCATGAGREPSWLVVRVIWAGDTPGLGVDTSGMEHSMAHFMLTLFTTLGYGGIVIAMAIESCCIPLYTAT